MKSLVAILLLAAFLRLFNLSSLPAGLYWDEVDTGYQAFSLLNTGRDYFGNLLPAHMQSFADYRSGLYMYLTVPFVKLLGLTPIAVRLPAIFASLLSVIAAWIFSRRVLRVHQHAWILPLVIATSPWTLVQGRIAAESQLLIPLLLLGMVAFLSKSYKISAISFGLLLWSYPTAKVFVPVLLLLILIVYRSKLHVKKLLIPVLLFVVIAFLPLYETLASPVGRRFSEVSVFTDPTIPKKVEIGRLQSYLGGGGQYRLGLQAGLMDRLMFNKYSFWVNQILVNYVSALSTGFLFTSGDPNLRHNLGLINTGQFYLISIIPFMLGLFYILKSYFISDKSKLILWWLLLSPLPAIFTRDGGTHAPRLLFLFIPMAALISLGLNRLYHYRKIFIAYLGLFTLCIITTVFYMFTSYRVTSAGHFNAGFLEAAKLAITNQSHYRQAILDGANESLLMAYLFTSQYPPSDFQKSFPLPSTTVINGVEGYRFGNIIILYPGTRDWNQIKIPGNNLIIVSSIQPNSSKLPHDSQVDQPDHSPAFIITESNSEN